MPVDLRSFIRLFQLVLIVIAIGLAAFPLLVILDLAGGGTGYGLCPAGVDGCRNPYTAAAELLLVLSLGLIIVLGGFRMTTRLRQRLARQRQPR